MKGMLKTKREEADMKESYFKRVKRPVASPEEAKPIIRETKIYLLISIVALFVFGFLERKVKWLSIFTVVASFAMIYFALMWSVCYRAVGRMKNLICEKCGAKLGNLENTTYEELSRQWSGGDYGNNAEAKLHVTVRFNCKCTQCGTVKAFTEVLGAGNIRARGNSVTSEMITTKELVEEYLNGMIHA